MVSPPLNREQSNYNSNSLKELPMQQSSRREFLKTAGLLIATSGGWVSSGYTFSSGPDLQFPTLPRERLAVSSWPFRALIKSPTNREYDPKQPGMDLTDFPEMVVSRFNLRRIEPIGDHFGSTNPAYLETFNKALQKVGVHIVDIPAPTGGSLFDPDIARRGKTVETAKKWVDIASTLGSPSIQVGIHGVESVSPNLDRTAESLQQIVDYAARKKIVINLENDNLVTEDAFFLVKVIEKVNHPYLHALPDFCNSMLSGDEKFNYDAVTAMFRHAYNISHVKDSEMNSQGKLFKIDIDRTFAIAKASGYRGYFSMEWEGDGEPYAGTKKLIDASLKNLGG
jgi:sugar phosphate isomerase/epimerase